MQGVAGCECQRTCHCPEEPGGLQGEYTCENLVWLRKLLQCINTRWTPRCLLGANVGPRDEMLDTSSWPAESVVEREEASVQKEIT